MGVVSGGGGGGGPAAGTYLPVANSSGVTVDSTTYNDPIAGGGAKLTTLVFPADQGAIAMARSGDTYPRWLFASDPRNDGLYMNDGTNPTTSGGEIYSTGNGTLALVGGGNSLLLRSNRIDLGAGVSIDGVGAGVVGATGGYATLVISSGALPTQTFASGTAAQVSTTRDVFLCIPFTGDATNNAATLKIELSPDNTTFSTLDTMSIAAALNLTGALNVPVTIHVPATWYVKLTATHGTIGTGTYY